jgi:hypothetical protein
MTVLFNQEEIKVSSYMMGDRVMFKVSDGVYAFDTCRMPVMELSSLRREMELYKEDFFETAND